MSDDTQQGTAVDRAQRVLIAHILDGTYPIGSELPGERPLSKELGLARPALREALQRLNQNGWLETSQGRATRVRDYLRDGHLNVLIDVLTLDAPVLETLLPNLLHLWAILAHDYTHAAYQQQAARVGERLALYSSLADNAEASTQAMWQLHRALIEYSGNAVYGLMLNSFAEGYQRFATLYYSDPSKRDRARALWAGLHAAAEELDSVTAADLMRDYIQSDTQHWQDISQAQTVTHGKETAPPTDNANHADNADNNEEAEEQDD